MHGTVITYQDANGIKLQPNDGSEIIMAVGMSERLTIPIREESPKFDHSPVVVNLNRVSWMLPRGALLGVSISWTDATGLRT